jgi:hypothetical protein
MLLHILPSGSMVPGCPLTSLHVHCHRSTVADRCWQRIELCHRNHHIIATDRHRPNHCHRSTLAKDRVVPQTKPLPQWKESDETKTKSYGGVVATGRRRSKRNSDPGGFQRYTNAGPDCSILQRVNIETHSAERRHFECVHNITVGMKPSTFLRKV